jgi:hypothetical protein
VSADRTYRPVRRPTARTEPPHLNQRRTSAAPRGRDERSAVGVERRRRQRRFQQLRRDLLGDALIGFLLALIVAPGLAVIAIASIPVTLVVAGTVVAERPSRKRRHRDRPRANRRASG